MLEYALAFINHELCRVDHGRMLGYDNAHGFPERHWMGKAEPAEFTDFEALLLRFKAEINQIQDTQ